MGILLLDTADLRDLGRFYDVNVQSGFIVSSDVARTGVYSYKSLASSLYYGSYSFAATSSGYARVATYGGLGLHLQDTGGQTHAIVDQGSSLTTLTVCGSVEDTVGSPGASQWHVWEIYWNIDNAAGEVTVKLNGTQVLTFSGDTNNAGTNGDVKFLRVVSSEISYTYFDDICVRDDDWPGRGGVYVLQPNAGSTTEDWTASAGDPEDCVDELPADFADYISTDASVNGTQHLFGIESLPISPETINGLAVVGKLQTSDGTGADAKVLLKAGTTLEAGTSGAVDSDARWIDGYWTNNPDDAAAWEEADITALEVGVESVV